MGWKLTDNEISALVMSADRVCFPWRTTKRVTIELDGEMVTVDSPWWQDDTPQPIRDLGTIVDIITDRGAIASQPEERDGV
jgi:hypothetical protein